MCGRSASRPYFTSTVEEETGQTINNLLSKKKLDRLLITCCQRRNWIDY